MMIHVVVPTFKTDDGVNITLLYSVVLNILVLDFREISYNTYYIGHKISKNTLVVE